jgi:hypothetical protein
MMDSLETACACPTVGLDGGDQMQGSLESNLTFGYHACAMRSTRSGVRARTLSW